MAETEYGAVKPEMFALVVVSGEPNFLTSSSDNLCPGTRIPMVFDFGFRNAGKVFFRFTIMVSGPGQYLFAKESAVLLKSPYFCAIFKFAAKIETGLFLLICFNLYKRTIALLLKASQANP